MGKERVGATLRRNDRVELTADLPGVPAGSRGKVYLANGFEWKRYRVLFDNGADIGAISEDQLVRIDRNGRRVAASA